MKRKLSFIVLIGEIIAISILHAIKVSHTTNDSREISSQGNSIQMKFPPRQFMSLTQVNSQLEK